MYMQTTYAHSQLSLRLNLVRLKNKAASWSVDRVVVATHAQLIGVGRGRAHNDDDGEMLIPGIWEVNGCCLILSKRQGEEEEEEEEEEMVASLRTASVRVFIVLVVNLFELS